MPQIVTHKNERMDDDNRRLSLIKGNIYTRQVLKKTLITDFTFMTNDEILADNLLLSFEFEEDEFEEDEDL